MATVPEVKFARTGSARVAWSTWGEGPDVLVVPGLFSNIEVAWEHEISRRVLEFTGEHTRQISFDKRGMGLSDRFVGAPSLEQHVSDVLAVLDEAGAETVSLIGVSEGGAISSAFAARHPERVERLVLANALPGARITAEVGTDDDAEELAAFFGRVFAAWGEDATTMLERFAPSQRTNPGFVRWLARYQRQASTAHDVIAHAIHASVLEIYDDLPLVQAPTLVINCEDDQIIDARTGDRLAERIPDAERMVFEGGDHFFWLSDRWTEMVGAGIGFITGEAIDRPSRRAFGTVVFTDIVGSTSATADVGDATWRDRLDAHDRIAWSTSDRHVGTIVKSTGDGLLAHFPTPGAAVEFAVEFRDALAEVGLPIRAGLHAGEIEIRHNNDITGIAVNLAARVEQVAADGGIYASSTVRDMMLGGSTEFTDRGEHDLKGIDGRWRLYEVASTTG